MDIRARGLPAGLAAAALLLASACGDSGPEAAPTPGTIIEGNAVQIFLREAYKVGWISADDAVEVESEPLEYEEALERAFEMDLSLYPTLPGTPPFPGGLHGWLITIRGEFYDVPQGSTPTPGAPRRPAVAAAFVDTQGRLTYSMRFTDVTPAPQTPKETLPPTYP